MKVCSIKINNFRNTLVKDIDFKKESGEVKNFVAIIGDNGVGKTSILEAITKAFTPIIRSISKGSVDKCDLNDNDIKHGEKWTAVFVEIELNNKIYSWYNKRKIKKCSIEYPPDISTLSNLKEVKNEYIKCCDEERLPLILYYGTNRVVRDIPKRGHIKEYKVEDALKNCFDNVNYFRDFYEWFKTEEDLELRELKDNPSYVNFKLESVREAIANMIPGYNNLRIKLNPSRMIITNGNGENLRIEQLSGGYKAVLSMVADIAKRLAMANPNSKNPLQEEAVILIDELDLHLHPRWQKSIVSDLKRTFPNCQFIVTTHSPFIVQSLTKEEIINIEKDNESKNGSYEGWSIEEIQEHEMGVDVKTQKYEDAISKFSEAIDNEDIKLAKEMYNQLINMIHPKSTQRRILDIDMAGIEDD